VDLVLPPIDTVFLFPSIADAIEVVGGTLSIVHKIDAGVGSLFPTLSEDITSIV
jgi:hypothetical protein